MALPYPPPETHSPSLSEPLNGRIKPKSLTEEIWEKIEARYNAEYDDFREGKRPKPAPLSSPRRFQAIIDEIFSEGLKGFIEARLNGELGDSLDNVALRICFTSLARELTLPAFTPYTKAKIFEADKVNLPSVPKDELDLAVEQARADKRRLKELIVRLEKGEVREDDYIRREDIERAKQSIRRRIGKA